MMRKYWVQFRAINAGQVALSEMEITRELPICEPGDVADISRAILQRLIADRQVGADAVVSVVAWTKFEEPSIILAQRH